MKIFKMKNMNILSSNDMIDLLSNYEICVIEDVQGSKIFINFDKDNFTIKAKSISSDPINLIDLAMQKFYNKAATFAGNLPERVRKMLNKNWWFGFEYFPDTQPAHIIYDKLPSNNLVLTSIYKGNKFDYTYEELDEYALLMGVDSIPIIYKGKLDNDCIEGIQYFLNTSPKDLEYIFGEKNFAYFFYRLLDPSSNASFLMDDNFQENLEKIIIKINDIDISFSIFNPLYNKMSDTNSTEYTDIYSLLILDFLTYCQTLNIDKLKLDGDRKDIVYINIICRLFNTYLKYKYDELINFEFVIPRFFREDKFKINKNLLKNKTTIKYIENEKIEYIFKCILSSFYRKKKNPIGQFTEDTLEIFNQFVEDLQSKIDSYLGMKSEVLLRNSGLLKFSDYFNIKYDKDADGKVYIMKDIYDELGLIDKKKKFDKNFGKIDLKDEFDSSGK